MNYRIKIFSQDNENINDIGDEDFTLTYDDISSQLTVTSPNGGETWQIGETHEDNLELQ